MNEHTIKGKWNQIKGDIRNLWGNLADEDIDRAGGNMTSLAGVIQEKYGHAKDDITRKLDEIFAKYDSESANSNTNYQQDLRKDIDVSAGSKI